MTRTLWLRITRSVLVPVLLLGHVVVVAAQDTPVLSRVLESGQLRIGVSGTQPPMNALSRSGDLIGLEIDLGLMLADTLGVEAVFLQTPFPDLLDALHAGSVDIVMSSMAITPERAETTAFVGPYMISGKSLLTNSNALAGASETEEINQGDLRLAALGNSTSEEFIRRNLPDATFVAIQEYDEGVRMVMEDEVDAMIADMPICLLSLLRYPDWNLATLEQPLTVEPIGIALSPEDPRFATLLGQYLAAYEGTGLMEQLRAVWLDNGDWIAALP